MFGINELPKLVIRTILGQPLKRIPLEDQATDFPANVMVMQDRSAQHYIDVLKKILIYPISAEIRNNKDFLDWQIKQCYRILNASTASCRSCMAHCRPLLTQLRQEVEESESVSNWIAQLNNPPLICSGHGYCDPDNGYITNLHGCEVNLFNPIGSSLGNDLGIIIENDLFKKEAVIGCYKKEAVKFTFEKYSFPQIFSGTLTVKLPNLILFSRSDLRARIIESQTLRVLYEFKHEIKLHDILKMYPQRKILWAACASVQKKDLKISLGPNAGFRVCNRTEIDFPVAEKHLRRSRKWSSKMTYDERFLLFSSSRGGTVNPVIEQDYKRLKVYHP